jgi:hypothetical protein
VSKHVKNPALIKVPDFFSQLEPLERRTCRDYLLSQEIVRQQRILKRDPKSHQYTQTVPDLVCPGQFQTIARVRRPQDWVATRVAMIRKAWGVGKNFTSTPLAGSPLWFNHPATRLVVLWPEWPGKPYFEISQGERLRRTESFSTLLDEKEQWAALEYLLNPYNPLTRKKVLIKIALCPDSLTLQEHREAFDALLRIHAPELFRGAKTPSAKQGGRKSEEARVLDDLNAFAAYQLCKVQKVPRACAIKLICYPKGHLAVGQPVYSSPNELNKPLRRFLPLLQRYCTELVGNLVPLRPDPPGSPPDFSQLNPSA